MGTPSWRVARATSHGPILHQQSLSLQFLRTLPRLSVQKAGGHRHALLALAALLQDPAAVDWLPLDKAKERAADDGRAILLRQILCGCDGQACGHRRLARTVFLTPALRGLHDPALCAWSVDMKTELDHVLLLRAECFSARGELLDGAENRFWRLVRFHHGAPDCSHREAFDRHDVGVTEKGTTNRPWAGLAGPIAWGHELQAARARRRREEAAGPRVADRRKLRPRVLLTGRNRGVLGRARGRPRAPALRAGGPEHPSPAGLWRRHLRRAHAEAARGDLPRFGGGQHPPLCRDSRRARPPRDPGLRVASWRGSDSP
jgi:hypothetical protein